MARDFDGVNDVVSYTLSAHFVESTFTIGAWIKPRTVGATTGRIYGDLAVGFFLSDGGAFPTKGLGLVHNCTGATTLICTSSANAWAANEWRCVFATFLAGTALPRTDYGLFSGSLASSVASVGVNGTGSADGTAPLVAPGTTSCVGNMPALTRTFDGAIERFFAVPWVMTVDEMERFRLGDISVIYTRGTPVIFAPLNSPTAAQAEDLSGRGYLGSVTGALAAEGPPVPFNWGGVGRA